MAFQSQEDVVTWYKRFDPRAVLGKSDEEIYNLASDWTNEKYGFGLKDFEVKVAPTSSEGMRITNMDGEEGSLARAKTSPDDIKGLAGLASRIGTTGVSGWLAEMGGVDLPGTAFDITPEFFQKSYNESLAGQLYQAIHGQSAYNTEDYESEEHSWGSEAGSFIVGMLNVPEAAAYMTGARLGLWGATKTTGALHKYGMIGVNASAKRKLEERAFTTHLVNSGLETGIALGTLGASHSAAADAAQQRLEGDGTIDPVRTMKAGAWGFGESFIIGAPAGLISKGWMGGKYAMAKFASDKKTLDLSTKAMYGLPSQIGVEALAFTTFPNIYRAAASPFGKEVFKDYPTIGSEEWNKALFQNTAVVGTMTGFGKIARNIKGYDESYIWAQNLLKQANRDTEVLLNSAENIKNSFAESGVDINPEMLNMLAKTNERFALSDGEFKTFKANQENIIKIFKKSAKGEQLSVDDISFLETNLMPTKLIELGLWKELQQGYSQNKEILRKIIKETEGLDKEISDSELETYKIGLDKKINDTIDTFADINEIITGIRGKPKGPSGAAPTFTPVIMRRKRPLLEYEGQSETEIRTFRSQEELTKAIQDSANLPVESQWQNVSQVTPDISGPIVVPTGNPTAEFSKAVTAASKKALEQTGVAVDYNSNIVRAREIRAELENEIFSYIGKGGDRKEIPNSNLIKSIEKNTSNVMEGSGDRAAVIEYGLSRRKITNVNDKTYRKDNQRVGRQAKIVSKFVDWLHKTQKKTLKEVDFLDDIFVYINNKLTQKAGKLTQASQDELSALAKFFEYSDGKFVPNGVGLRIQKQISFKDINEYIKERSIEVDVKDLNEVDRKIQDVYNELDGLLKGNEFKMAKSLVGLIKYGIRPEEIGRLTKNNIRKSDKEGYYINLGYGKEMQDGTVPKIFKDKTFGNVIPISTSLAELILSLPSKTDMSPIFYNFASKQKVRQQSILPYIAKSVFGQRPDGKNYTYANTRQLLRTKYRNVGISKEDMDVYMRHEKTRIELTYEREQVNDQLRRHKEIQEKLGIGEEGKFQFELIGKPESVETLAPWLNQKIKQNRGLKIRKLEDAEFVGRFYEGVIDITMGKANKFTFFHENAHRLKAMIDASGNVRLSKAWRQAEDLFRNDAKKQKRDLEEFISDEIAKYGLKREQPASIKNKMKGWINRFWSTVKSVFFGKERLSKKDVMNILGEKVYKGFAFNTSAKASSISKFKYANVEEMARGIKKDFNRTIENAGLRLPANERKALIKYISETARIENPEKFRLGDSSMSEQDMILFMDTFKTIPYHEMKGITNIVEKAGIIRNIDNVVGKVLTPKQQENVMKLVGFKKKSLWGSDIPELKAYLQVVNSLRLPGQDRLGGLIESATTGELSDAMTKMDGVLGEAALKGLPVGSIIRKLGASKIANALENHMVVELNHHGKFTLFEDRAAAEVGKGRWNKAFGRGIKDSLYLIDIERYIERKNNGQIKKYEQNFIDKAFKSDWVIMKDGKLVKNPEYKELKKAINLDTPEGRIVKQWTEFTDYIYDAFHEAVRTNLGEAEYLNFKANNKINWIRDNIYVSRLLTPEFKRTFNIDGEHFLKLIDEQAAPLAKELAKEKYGTDKPTDEQIGSVWEDAQMYVRENLYDMFQFGKGRHQTRFLKKRHIKLPEEVEVDGKKIQVYETKYEDTLKPYALGMSKFLANTEVFPEYVKLNNFHFASQKASLQKLTEANPKWGQWIIDQVEKQLGYGKNFTDYSDMFSRGLSNLAQTLAKTQLSFPTSGLKNLILGQGATLQAFRINEYFRGIGRVMSKEFRDEVKAMGATELGLRHIQDLKANKLLDSIFWFGGMKPTENFNRYISVASSKIEQARFAEILRNKKSPNKKIEQVERKLKKFYGLSNDQIALLKKYGMGSVDNVNFKSSYAKSKAKREIQKVYDKMNTMAHIKTQGASLSQFMPAWADNKYLRPLTLFKRMAYASTNNTLNNASIAWKNGDYMKLVMTAVGPYLTGQALMAAYELVFDETPPKENSDWGTYLKHTMVRGEALGVLSDFLRMYEGESAEFTMYPAVYNFADLAIFQTFIPLYYGHKTLPQGGHDLIKGTFGGYRAYRKVLDKKFTPFNNKMSKYRKLYYDFLKEEMPNLQDDGIGERKLTRRSPYYTDLKSSFYKDTVENFTKQAILTVYATATDLFNENVTAEGHPTKYKSHEEALRQAVANLKTSLKKLNPNPGSFIKPNKSLSGEWMAWLAKDKGKAQLYYSDLREIEAEYHHKIRQFKRLLPHMLKSKDALKIIQDELRKLK